MVHYIFLFILFFSTARASISTEWKYGKASNEIAQGNYAQAQTMLQSMLVDEPDRPDLLYDLGVISFKNKEYEQAAAYFGSAANVDIVDPLLQEQALFNLGNASVELNLLNDAIVHYEKVLELNENNEHARHNLEVVKKMLEEQEQQKQQDQQNKDDQQQDQKKDQNKDKNNQNNDSNCGQNGGEGDNQQEGEQDKEKNDSSSDEQDQKDNKSQNKDDQGDSNESDEKRDQRESDEKEQKDSHNNQQQQNKNQQEQDRNKSDQQQDMKDQKKEKQDDAQKSNKPDKKQPHQEDKKDGADGADQSKNEKDKNNASGPVGMPNEADLNLPPEDQWILKVLDKRENDEKKANKELIRASIDKKLGGQNGQNCW